MAPSGAPSNVPATTVHCLLYVFILLGTAVLAIGFRAAVQAALVGLVGGLRRWEAADGVAEHELRGALDALARAEYLAPAGLGLLGVAGALHGEAVAAARGALWLRAARACERLRELVGEMQEVVGDLEALRRGLGEGPAPPSPPRASALACAPAARAALRDAGRALRSELALRRSLLDALAELERSSSEDERQRLFIAWTERAYAPLEDGCRLLALRRGASAALEGIAAGR
ncbi:unnamed protein product [Prorocentrum cordatum]|uniref:Uncharacterized protein n=1 Tax=Prorocentrum cordatum TaxID=2364126 RepID=A0ABN9ULY7_9DINO|nr:unnamed protein product [Polarella glacialis]